MYKNSHIDVCIIPCINVTLQVFGLYSALRNICSPLRNVCSPLRNIRSALRNITQLPILQKYQQAMRNNNCNLTNYVDLLLRGFKQDVH